MCHVMCVGSQWQLWPCRQDAPQQQLQLFKAGDLAEKDAQAAWHPFSASLEDAGIPKGILRAPLVKKLQDAGFSSLLDVRASFWCHAVQTWLYAVSLCKAHPHTCRHVKLLVGWQYANF